MSFQITSIDNGQCEITVEREYGFSYYYVYCRTDYPDAEQEEVYSSGWLYGQFSEFTVSFDVEEDMPYAVNVAYNTSASMSGAQWMGTETFETYAIECTLEYYDDDGTRIYQRTYENIVGRSYGNVHVNLPSRSKDGYVFEGWIYNGRLYPFGETTDWYGTDSGETYQLIAKWKKKSATPYIFAKKNNVSDWYPAIPYIFTNNEWREASPFVFSDGQWRPQA